MIVYEFKAKGKIEQYRSIDEAIRTFQFIRNKTIRFWMDNRGIKLSDFSKLSAVLAKEFEFAKRLNSQARQAATERAGKQPLQRLETALKGLEQHSILVIDQFEELFTLCEDKAVRQEFIEKLFHLAEGRKVVITMRADFLGECTFYPELRKRIETRQKLVGPMEPAELTIAMKMQADSAGLRFEAGLSHAILNDVQGEPGVMPLLQYALQELWKRRRGRWLCADEYQAIGGVQQAIAKTADDFYKSLSDSEQEQIQNIFLRLTQLDANAVDGEKRRDTRRRVELEDLVPTGGDLSRTKNLVQQLAGEGVRLLVTRRNESTGKVEVEVAHEALIRHWPNLQNWLNENRSDLQLRETINQAALEWHQHQEQPDKDSYLIHHGGRLEDAQKLLTQPKSVRLNQEETEYVLACLELRDRLRKQEEQAYLWDIKTKRSIKQKQQDLDRVNYVAFSPDGQFLASIQQDGTAYLENTKTAKSYKLEAKNLTNVVGVVFSADSQLLACFWENGTIRLWNTKTQKWVEEFNTNQKERNQAKATKGVFSPNSQLLAVFGDDNTIQMLNIKGQLLAKFQGHPGGVESLAFSPDSQLLVSSGGDRTVRLWDIADRQTIILTVGSVSEMVFSPDNQRLAIVGDNGIAYLWDTKGKYLSSPQGFQGEVKSMAFSRDNQLLLATTNEGIVRLWDGKGKLLVTFSAEQEINSLAIAPDGQQLAFGNSEGVWLGDSKGKKQLQLPEYQAEKITSLLFSPDSQHLAVGGSHPIKVRNNWFWLGDTKSQPLVKLPAEEVNTIAFSADSQRLVTGQLDGTILFWDTKGKQLDKLQGYQDKAKFLQLFNMVNDDISII